MLGLAQLLSGGLLAGDVALVIGEHLCLNLNSLLAAGLWAGVLAQYSSWLPTAAKGPGVPHLPMWLDSRSYQGAGVIVCLSCVPADLL